MSTVATRSTTRRCTGRPCRRAAYPPPLHPHRRRHHPLHLHHPSITPSLRPLLVQGDVPILRLLLGRRDLDVNRQTKQKAWSPLHLAARHGHTEAVTLLMRHSRLDVNILSLSREAPIHVAAHKGHAAVVKLLAGHAAADATFVAEANEKLRNPSPRKGKGDAPAAL